jgi:hypothetical protein
MKKGDFIEKWLDYWKLSGDRSEEFISDIDKVLNDQTVQTKSIVNEFEHVMKCPVCGNWIFFNNDLVHKKYIGGHVESKTIYCHVCNVDVTLYPWRCL